MCCIDLRTSNFSGTTPWGFSGTHTSKNWANQLYRQEMAESTWLRLPEYVQMTERIVSLILSKIKTLTPQLGMSTKMVDE